MAQEIRKYYFGASTVCKETAMQYINLMSDVYFVYGIDKAAKIHAEKSSGKTFYYMYVPKISLKSASPKNFGTIPGGKWFLKSIHNS